MRIGQRTSVPASGSTAGDVASCGGTLAVFSTFAPRFSTFVSYRQRLNAFLIPEHPFEENAFDIIASREFITQSHT